MKGTLWKRRNVQQYIHNGTVDIPTKGNCNMLVYFNVLNALLHELPVIKLHGYVVNKNNN